MKGEQLSRCRRIGNFFHNKEKGTVLGRTPKSWGLIFAFYLVAYAFLAGFFIGMISVFMYGYVDTEIPSLTGMQSLLSLNPGVTLTPRVSTTTAFLQLTSFQSSINAPYIEGVKSLFKQYDPTELNADCPDGTTGVNFPDTPCRFPLTSLGACADPETSLNEGKPCIYLRLNKIFGWLPNLSNDTVFPQPVIKCYGQNELAEFQLDEPEYFPPFTANGQTYAMIPTTYFPFIRQPGYQVPLVAVRFPRMMRNTVVLVECKVYGLKDVDSTVNFEMVFDDKKTVA